jgi:uncharacterized protein involved in exopolysaccharide biosynthesis
VQLRSQLNELRIEREGLMTTFSPEHVRVRTIDRKIARIDELLQREISVLTETINGYRARLDTLLSVEPEITRLSRSDQILSDSYEVYRKAAEDRQIMRQQEARVQIQIVDPPSIPYTPRGPVLAVLVAAGIGLGLLSGVGTALLLVFLQQRPDRLSGRAAASDRAEDAVNSATAAPPVT